MPENTVVYGSSGVRRIQNEKPQVETPLTFAALKFWLIDILNHWIIPCLLASDPAAGLPDEDPTQLPSPEEDGKRKQHPCEKLKTSELAFLSQV